ncbi:unnamed protein product, partial [Polarella glacialis]
ATGDEVHRRCAEKVKDSGLRCEDLVELCWNFCAAECYHHEMFQTTFGMLADTPKVTADALCQLYEVHLALEAEQKDRYAEYRIDSDAVSSLLEHYKDNRKEGRCVSERVRSDVVSSLKSLVDGTVNSNHRTSLGLLSDVAALRKKSSTDGYIHLEIDSALTLVRALDQDESATVVDGGAALRRRIMQKNGLRLVAVRESEWRGLDDTKEKRRHLKSLLAALGDVLE